MGEWTISPGRTTDDGVDAAIREYGREVSRRVWGRFATEEELRKALVEDPHDDLAPPSGAFLIARSEDEAILGYVGVKRLYVRPAGRGTGVGKGLLHAAETAARELGAERVVLETNTQLTEARGMYEAHGYQETSPYNDGRAADHWYAKTLDGLPL